VQIWADVLKIDKDKIGIDDKFFEIGGNSINILKIQNRINRLFDNAVAFHLDMTMVFAAFGLSLVAGLIAGLYPAWRICRVAPATYLKLQ
jgi:ABC-type lipoprotein release transport system permease subunit